MARTEARILNSVWDDPDFRSLSPTAQWAYFFLLSQDDLTHLGVLPLRVRRWATKSANGMTVQILADALRELERSHYIVADRDTEELLIRSLIRRDKIFKQPQVFRAAADALVQLSSAALRTALADELDRIAAEESMVAASLAILADMRAALAQSAPHPAGHPAPHSESETEPECAPARPGERGVVTVVTTVGPVPRSPGPRSPDPVPLASLAAAGEPTAPSTQTLIGEWIDECAERPPDRTIGAVSKRVKALLGEGIRPETVRAGLALWRTKGAAPAALDGFVNQAANAQPRASPGGVLAVRNGSPPLSTADIRAGSAFALADHYLEVDGS